MDIRTRSVGGQKVLYCCHHLYSKGIKEMTPQQTRQGGEARQEGGNQETKVVEWEKLETSAKDVLTQALINSLWPGALVLNQRVPAWKER
jgi:hypothetical protein